jgi:dUTP pyrophosphatase
MPESNLKIPLKLIDPSIEPPQAQNRGDAGYDLRSSEEYRIEPGQRVLISTGIALAIPEGYAGFVQPRSGLAIKNGIAVLNTPGLIDSGYRDEIKVILINHDQHETFVVNRGDRIAQLVIQEYETIDWVITDDLESSDRGTGGFGSTGV